MTININNYNFNEETVIEIGKFAILWNIFENTKCDKDCNSSKLKHLVIDQKTNEFWKRLSLIFKNRVIVNKTDTFGYAENKLSLGNKLTTEQKEKVIAFIESKGKECLFGGLIAIYRIRNNMFHGLKDWTNLDNQINLFKGINEFLAQAIQFL